jgi:hypothetical protein
VSQGEMDSRGLVGLVAAADESWAASESPVSVCTGTKIADGFILTARHCVHTREGDLRHVSFATDLFTPAGMRAAGAPMRSLREFCSDGSVFDA